MEQLRVVRIFGVIRLKLGIYSSFEILGKNGFCQYLTCGVEVSNIG